MMMIAVCAKDAVPVTNKSWEALQEELACFKSSLKCAKGSEAVFTIT